MNIPLSSPDITEAEIAAVTAVLRTSRLSLGQRLDAFERAFADYINTQHAIAVSSGTAALHLCIRALNIGEGDEVIVPSFTFIATTEGVALLKLKPVFVDVVPKTFGLYPVALEKAIAPKTRAIIPVHL